MLVDIDYQSLRPDGLALALSSMGSMHAAGATRLAKGVYETGLNWNHTLRDNGLLVTEYPFWPRPDYTKDTDGRMADLKALIESYGDDPPADYGVCDTWEQIVERFPIVEEDPRSFVISLTPIVKADQSPQGGWRWHKWGEYIGTQEPTHEYLYDEPDIEKVYVFHILEVVPQ